MKSNLNPDDHYPILARKSKCQCEFCKPKINKTPQMNKWLPTPENINALPEYLRDYIHQLEATCDPAGLVRENMQLKDTNDGLLEAARALPVDGLDAERLDAKRYRFASKHFVLAGGIERFGWPIAPCTPTEWDRYIDAAIALKQQEPS